MRFSPRSWLKSWRPAARRRTRRTFARLNLESLEDRQLLATFLVTNANNSGSGSLRQAILNANSTSALDYIEFRVGEGPKDLVPTSPLPAITSPVYLNGATQPGYNGTPLITIGGRLAGPFAEGLILRGNGSTVRALTFRSFNGHGIVVSGNSNVIERCYIGIDPFQTFGAGNRDAGVVLEGGYNIVRGSVISGNGGSGVVISGTRARNNRVGSNVDFLSNYIGTNATGTVAVPNGQNGVWIGNGASSNTVGTWAGVFNWNVISGNNWAGVALVHSGTIDNQLSGNLIGTTANGEAPLGNGAGVFVGQGARLNRIGSHTGQKNVIAGNRNEGVVLTDVGTSHNTVESNHIGTYAGVVAVPNQKDGVWIGNGASNNTVGGTAYGARNVISGNNWSGVALLHGGTIGNVVQGNYIGTNFDTQLPLGNGAGVWIAQGASNNVIGGSSAEARNVISGNREQGVMLRDIGTHSNVVRGNYIGTDWSGTLALGNSQGVRLALGASFNTLGGGNLISGNRGEGVALTDLRTIRNVVQGNTIGTNAAGTDPLGNFDGIHLAEGANGNYIGGGAAGPGNLISSNRRHGVVLEGSNTSFNHVRGNSIRSNAGGGVAIGNGASANIIGGTAAGEINVIAHNGSSGVGTAAGGRNLLRRNIITENGALGIDIDSDGVTFAHVVWLTGASTSGPSTTVEGWVIGAPNATYQVELFENVAADPSGFGEGAAPLPGLHTVSTDADGYGYLLVTLPVPVEVGRCVSATATQADGTTWEFGNCLPVAAGGVAPGAPGHDAAQALSQAEVSRSVPLALPPSREQPLPESTPLRAESTPFQNPRPDGAAVNALFGGMEPLPPAAPPRRTAGVFPGEDGSLPWERVFASDAS